MGCAHYLLAEYNLLERHTLLPDGDLTEAVDLVAGFLAGGRVEDELHQIVGDSFGLNAFVEQLTGVKVDPVRLACGEVGIGGDLEGWCGHAERCAAAGGEEHAVGAGGGEGRGGHPIVAGGLD